MRKRRIKKKRRNRTSRKRRSMDVKLREGRKLHFLIPKRKIPHGKTARLVGDN